MSDLTRPGISSTTLQRAGVKFTDRPEPGSIEIPHYDLDGRPIGFSRIRLATVRPSGQKYTQPPDSGVRAYLAPWLAELLPADDLVVVEGEFKALSLLDAGIPAVGLPGLEVSFRDADDGGDRVLIPLLGEAIHRLKPKRILFLGDSDTAMNINFARNAVAMAELLPGLTVTLPRIPIDGPGKGVDDCRQALGDGFETFWRDIVQSAETFDSKLGSAALAMRLLRREWPAIVRTRLDEHKARLIKLGAALLRWPMEFDEIAELMREFQPGLTKSAFRSACEQVQGQVSKAIGQKRRKDVVPAWQPESAITVSQATEADRLRDLKTLASELRAVIVDALTNKDLRDWQRKEFISQAVVDGLRSVGRFYFHAEHRDFDAAMYFCSERKLLDRIRSDAFRAWLSDLIAVNRTLPLFAAVHAAIETASLNPEISTAILPERFWAARPGAFYLSTGDGAAIKITAAGPAKVDNGTDGVLFEVGSTLPPWRLVDPISAFDTCQLFRPGRFVDSHGPLLAQLWTYSLPSNPRCKPPLCLVGDIGSGKTRLAKGVAELYGIPFVGSKVEESREDDFWVNCDAGGLYCLDNADSRCTWLPDALAAAATDGCSKRRKLYTNTDACILRARAWLAITSANPLFASDPGLADRLLVVRMARADGSTSDVGLGDEIAANRDAGLAHIAVTLAAALADQTPTPDGINRRHPDFGHLAIKVGRSMDLEAEAIQALTSAETDKARFCLENDSVGMALLALMAAEGTFSGTAADLQPKLFQIDPDLNGKLSAKRLGKKLNALWPHIQGVMTKSNREMDRNKVWNFAMKLDRSAGFAGFQTAFP